MKIKLLVMDVDGTLTDGRLYIGDHGEVMKAFDVKDGYAIAHFLPEAGIVPVIITAKESKIVERRAEQLGIMELYQHTEDKVTCLKKLAEKYHLVPEEIAYIGDDLFDLEGMSYCGFSACPADSVEEIKKVADYVCIHKGGRGAVREVIEKITREMSEN